MRVDLRPLIKLHNSPYYKVLRVRQWIKNGSLFLAILFGGRLLEPDYFLKVLWGAIIFCGLSSGTYILNDIADIPFDKIHPLKKMRPLASGKIPLNIAQLLAVVLTLGSLALAFYTDAGFFMAAATYVLVMVAYSLVLKRIPVIDALTVAFGFVLRVFAGSFIAETPISALLILTTIFTALFISFAKRRAEATLLENQSEKSRTVLKDYPIYLVDKYLTLTFGAAFITYSFFMYQSGFRISSKLLTNFLPSTLAKPNWLMLTIPVVFYAMSRYMYLIYERKEGESPENIVLTDKILLCTSTLWLTLIIFFLY